MHTWWKVDHQSGGVKIWNGRHVWVARSGSSAFHGALPLEYGSGALSFTRGEGFPRLGSVRPLIRGTLGSDGSTDER